MQFLFFLFFIVSVLILGSITVGPYSVRVYMTVLMMFYLITFRTKQRDKSLAIRSDYIRRFLVCILTLFVSLTINGGLEVYGFWERLLAYYLVCVVAYYAVDYFVREPKHFDKIVFVLSMIIILDTTATILQYMNDPIGWGVGAIFSDVDEFADFLNDHESFVGVSKLPGIFGHPVNNGFFLSVTTVLLLSGIKVGKGKGKGKDIIISLYYIAVYLSSLAACLFLQQRSAFYLILLFTAYHYLKAFLTHPGRIIIPTLIVVVLLLIFLPDDIGSFDAGRLTRTDNTSRTGVWEWAFTVILQNPIFGNILQYNAAAEYSAHNVLIDSLIDAGIVGFIPMFILYMKTVLDSTRIMLRAKNNYLKVFSYSVLTCMGMGMFHNTSYMTGDVIIFIVLALMFKAQKLSGENCCKVRKQVER